MLFLLAWAMLMPVTAGAELRIAVASNYQHTLQQLVQVYRQAHPDFSVRLSSASSGKHHAQIRQGAPFDLFFSGDDWRTADLEAGGLTVPGSRFAYAHGQLVLWSADPNAIPYTTPADGLALLRSGNFNRLAMANPRVAPYGVAAEQLLADAGITLGPRQRVTGQSIGQAFGFVVSGNADLGLVAASQVVLHERSGKPGSHWFPPADSYPAIVQEAVILKRATDNIQARDFMHWIKCSQAAHELMQADGYRIPERHTPC